MSLSEIVRSLFGIWRLFLIDKRGVVFFDNTRDRTIRSFLIPTFCYLLILIAIIVKKSDIYEGALPFGGAILVQALGFIMSLCGYLLATYSIVKHLKKKKEFMRYVQVNNWMAIVAFLLVLPVILIGQTDDPLIHFFLLMMMIFRKIYDWFIVQSVFEIQWYWILFVLFCKEVIDALISTMAYTIIY